MAASDKKQMTETTAQHDQAQLRRYLLGQANAEEGTSVEERLMTDEQYFARLHGVEEGLIDQYVCDDLNSAERRQFERYFSKNPARREAVEFAKTLRQIAVTPEKTEAYHVPQGTSWLPKAVVAVAACLLLAAMTISLLLYWQTARLKEQMQRMQAEKVTIDDQTRNLQAQIAALSEELSESRRQPASVQPPSVDGRQGRATFTLLLSPGLNREPGENATLTVPPDERLLRLELEVADQRDRSYEAELQTMEGTVVRKWNHLRSQGPSQDQRVIITLPISLITRSDYLVVLTSQTTGGKVERAGSYYFKTTRK